MRRLILTTLIISLLFTSCGQTTVTADPSGLRQSLSTIPAELVSHNTLWFTNMAKIKALAGIEGNSSAGAYLNLIKTASDKNRSQYLLDLLAGYAPSDFSGGKYLEHWQETYGFDALNTDEEVAIYNLTGSDSAQLLFSVMQGNFDAVTIKQKLTAQQYQIMTHNSVEYYSIGPSSLLSSRLGSQFLNRLMIDNQEIIAALTDDVFFPVLDVRSQKDLSLTGNSAYSTLADSLGDVLGAALLPPSQINILNIQPSTIQSGDYDLVGIGYQCSPQTRKIVVALHYSDKSAASGIEKINQSARQYTVKSAGANPVLLSDLFDIGIPQAVVVGNESVVKMELIYKAETHSELWSRMIEAQDLGFIW